MLISSITNNNNNNDNSANANNNTDGNNSNTTPRRFLMRARTAIFVLATLAPKIPELRFRETVRSLHLFSYLDVRT